MYVVCEIVGGIPECARFSSVLVRGLVGGTLFVLGNLGGNSGDTAARWPGV